MPTYHVSIHKSGEYRYASTQPPRVNPVTQKKECRHVHWGRLDENNKFYPNRRYMEATPAERAELIFPDDWDLSEIENIPIDQVSVISSADWRFRKVMEEVRLGQKAQEDMRFYGEKIRTLIEKLEQEGLSDDKILEIVKCMV